MKAPLLAIGLWLAPQADLTEVRAAVAAGDYPRAWELTGQLRDELLRARARSEVQYRAGDPSGALAFARGGLDDHPDDLELLFRASSAALWLQESALANLYVARLEVAVTASRARFTPDEAAAWAATVEDFRERTRNLASHEEARGRAVARARALSIGTLMLVLCLVAWTARRNYGRSSSPVS